MKAKVFTILTIAALSLAFSACNDEEIAPQDHQSRDGVTKGDEFLDL